MLVISWTNGTWSCRYHIYRERLRLVHTWLERSACSHGVRPREFSADWGRHIYRELNGYADVLANRHCYTSWFSDVRQRFERYRLFFDGSVTKTAAGCGWALYGAGCSAVEVETEWTLIVELSCPMPAHATITVCELEACVWGVAFAAALFEGREAAAEVLSTWKPLDLKCHRVLKLALLVE